MEKFCYDNLAEGHIRLLHLLPGSRPPCGTLLDVPLDQAGEYDGVSYVWGDETGENDDFICNGKIIRVRDNLYKFILRLIDRNENEPGLVRPIWVDAICINQSNVTEKSCQIPLMPIIYKNAKTVVIWWGDSDREIEDAFDAMHDIFGVLERLPEPGEPWTYVAKEMPEGLPPESSPTWEGIRRIFRTSWMTRLWVLQELALPKDALVMIGSRSMIWSNFPLFLAMLNKAELQRLLDRDPLKTISYMNYLRIQTQEGNTAGLTLHVILEMMRTQAVTEPIDRVYGVLGLLPVEVQAQIRVNTAMSPIEAYHDFSGAFISRGNGYAIFSALESKERSKGLASWCPDFSSTGTLLPSGILSILDDVCQYRAGRILPPFLPRRMRVMEGKHMIAVPGWLVDEIALVAESDYRFGEEGKSMNVWLDCLEWEDECWRFARESLALEEDISEMYCRTLVVNQPLSWVIPKHEDGEEDSERGEADAEQNEFDEESDEGARGVPTKEAELSESTRQGQGKERQVRSEILDEVSNEVENSNHEIEQKLQYLDCGESGEEAGKLNRERSIKASVYDMYKSWKYTLAHVAEDIYFPKDVQIFMAALNTVCTGRRLFATKGSRLGQGPKSSRAGDVVAIFEDCPVPYLLRPTETEGLYELVGEIYVDGWMGREAMEKRHRGELKDEEFLLR